MIPEGFLEQIISNHNNRQILLLFAKLSNLFNQLSGRWNKAKVIFDKSWENQANFKERNDFPLVELEKILNDDKDFLIDLRSLSLIRNPSDDPSDAPTRTLTGIQIVELDSGGHNFWITKKSFLYLLNQFSINDNGKSWTLGKLNREIKFFQNLLIPHQDKRINLVNEKPALGDFSSEDMEMISINPEIIPPLQEIFKYDDPLEKFEFLEQIELDKSYIEIQAELTKRDKELKDILIQVSPELITKSFLKKAYKTIDSIVDPSVNIFQRVLDNNPTVKSKLNYILDGEEDLPSWFKSIGEILKFKKLIDTQRDIFERLTKEKIITLNHPDIKKIIENHSDISYKLKKIDNQIQSIVPELSRIKGKLTISIKLD